MKANRGRDTGPEVRLRSELYRRGMRYRLHYRALPGLHRWADIAFVGVRLAVFVDGCFWHGCPTHGTRARANAVYWDAKILENQRRDRDTDERLHAAGWTSLRVWEHEAPDQAAALVQRVYGRLASAEPSDRP